MYETLKSKIETIAENYADLVDIRIRSATQEELTSATVSTEILEAVRMLGHIMSTLERIDRLHCGNSESGQNKD